MSPPRRRAEPPWLGATPSSRDCANCAANEGSPRRTSAQNVQPLPDDLLLQHRVPEGALEDGGTQAALREAGGSARGWEW